MNALKKFQDNCKNSPLFIPLEQYAFEYKHSLAAQTLTMTAIIHGNEIGGLDILNELVRQIVEDEIKPTINIRFILGNIEAYQQGKRFLETDLNRSFSVSEVQSLEEKRAEQIERYLPGSDLFLDFHQTIEPTASAFMIFTYHEKNIRFARALNETLPIVTYANFSNLAKGRTCSATAMSKGIPAVTIETGEKGHNKDQLDLGLSIAKKAIQILETGIDFLMNPIKFENTFTWGETIKNPDFSLELVQRFQNFQLVKKDAVIAKNTKVEVKAPYEGAILFPKYDEQRLASPELVRILKAVNSVDEL